MTRDDNSFENKKWFFIYHSVNPNIWSTPKGFSAALKKLGIKVFEFTYANPLDFNFPSNKYFIENEIKVIISFCAGHCKILEENLSRIKKELNIFIVCELGDEPQTLIFNSKRAEISDLCLTPDYRSSLYWQNQGYKAVWFNHWADSTIYKKNEKMKKQKFVGTSMGLRKYHFLLKFLLGNSYINQRCSPEKNAIIYQKSKIVFQYARWDEITRRIFEAAACECCIVTNRLPSHTQIETIFAHNVSAIYYDNFFNLIFNLIRLKIKPELYKKIASNSYKIVSENHTEKERAKYLIKLINESR